MHHLDSWVKRDQLNVTCFIISLLMLNMFWMLIYPSSGACDLCAELFHGLHWSGSTCVGVTLWFGCGGVVSVCRLKHKFFNLHTDTTPPQPHHNVTPTHIEPDQCNPWNNSEHYSQAPENGCINPLTPNDHYSGRTAPLTSKRCILYIYLTNIGTEYFKHGIYSVFFFSKCSLFHNSTNLFGSCIIHILYTGCAKI